MLWLERLEQGETNLCEVEVYFKIIVLSSFY